MHVLQPKHIKLKEKEAIEVLQKFNVSKSQIPKILSGDPALPEDCEVGDIIKIERTEKDSTQGSKETKLRTYYRVVV